MWRSTNDKTFGCLGKQGEPWKFWNYPISLLNNKYKTNIHSSDIDKSWNEKKLEYCSKYKQICILYCPPQAKIFSFDILKIIKFYIFWRKFHFSMLTPFFPDFSLTFPVGFFPLTFPPAHPIPGSPRQGGLRVRGD